MEILYTKPCINSTLTIKGFYQILKCQNYFSLGAKLQYLAEILKNQKNTLCCFFNKIILLQYLCQKQITK